MQKNKRYLIHSFINHGNYVEYIIFDDIQSGQKCTGKVVTKFLEGEVYHWPRLKHSSLAPLLDIIYIDERLGMYMTTHLTHNLRDTFHDNSFVNDPLNFDRKKAYIADILWGVDYIHSKNLSLMNISDANVFVDPESDKAVIANFTCLVTVQNATKHKKCAPYMYRAPEVTIATPFAKKNEFDAISANLWSVGVMTMEIFMNHTTPWGLVDYEPSRALEIATKIDCDMLKIANKGSSISNQDLEDLKSFLALFLNINPKNRTPANKAVLRDFIQIGKYRVREKTDNFPIQSKRKLRIAYDSDKTDFSFNKSEESSMIEFNRTSYRSTHVPEVDIKSHDNLKEPSITNINNSRSKLKNSFKKFDHSNKMTGERISSKTDITDPITERSNLTHDTHIAIHTPKRQIARLNEIQEAATSLSLKLCKYYKELENVDRNNFAVNKSKLTKVGSRLRHDNSTDDLMTKRSSSITQANYAPSNNEEQKNREYSSDNTTKSRDSYRGSVCISKRFSEPRWKSRAIVSPKRNCKIFYASSPALQNLAFPLKTSDIHESAKQTETTRTKTFVSWEDKHTLSSEKTHNSDCVIENASVKPEETPTENMHVSKLMFNPSVGDKEKNPNITSKSQIYNNTWNIEAWTDETKNRKPIKCSSQGLINDKENQKLRSIERKIIFLPENSSDLALDDLDWLPNEQGLYETDEESFGLNRLFNSYGSNTSLNFNYVTPEDFPRIYNFQPRQMKVAKRRLGGSRRSQKEGNNKSIIKGNETQFYKPANDANNDNINTRQKCQTEMKYKHTENVKKKDYSITKQNCEKEKQFKQIANISPKDNINTKPKFNNDPLFKEIVNVGIKDKLSNKQKCEVSKALLNAQGNKIVGDIQESADQRCRSMVTVSTVQSHQQTNKKVPKDGAKKKKEKGKTWSCHLCSCSCLLKFN